MIHLNVFQLRVVFELTRQILTAVQNKRPLDHLLKVSCLFENHCNNKGRFLSFFSCNGIVADPTNVDNVFEEWQNAVNFKNSNKHLKLTVTVVLKVVQMLV